LEAEWQISVGGEGKDEGGVVQGFRKRGKEKSPTSPQPQRRKIKEKTLGHNHSRLPLTPGTCKEGKKPTSKDKKRGKETV